MDVKKSYPPRKGMSSRDAGMGSSAKDERKSDDRKGKSELLFMMLKRNIHKYLLV